MQDSDVVVFWFRRDLRLEDNRGLFNALSSGYKVLPVFIFDTEILEKLEQDDARVTFICEVLNSIQKELKVSGTSLLTFHGLPEKFFTTPLPGYKIKAVYANADYEPYAIARDKGIQMILQSKGIPLHLFHDQLIMKPGMVLKQDGTPYTVYTPFLKKWLQVFNGDMVKEESSGRLNENYVKVPGNSFEVTPESVGFRRSEIKVRPAELSAERIGHYSSRRDFPAIDGTTGLGPHIRFGTIGIREVMRKTAGMSQVFTSELVWREFFMHILSYYPHVTDHSFKPAYDNIEWDNNEDYFQRWCDGETGYPIVDAGMRELSATGYMHNRVRMITASFLVKHLLCDWRWGEAWFASRLLDFELSSNNGNWQWAAGTGCDAAPWFRVFNPELQQKKFDPDHKYIRRWVPEYGTDDYPSPVVNHADARNSAVALYKEALTRR